MGHKYQSSVTLLSLNASSQVDKLLIHMINTHTYVEKQIKPKDWYFVID